MEDELAAAFASRLASELRDTLGRAVGPELAALVARARAEAPGVEVDPVEFAGYLAERATWDAGGQPVLQSVHAGALWIACGCVAGEMAAVQAFEQVYAGEIGHTLRRSFDAALAEEAELRLRERLFLVGDDDFPRLASYSGRGDLRAWLRAAAVRTAIDLMRRRRTLPIEPAGLGDVGPAIDPLLAALKQRYRDEFRAAFDEASRSLTDRERTLLRYRFLDGLSIDEIAPLYRVHRATAARWIGAIREALFEGTRACLMARLQIDDDHLDSVLRLIDSQLDVSIELLGR